MRKRFLLMIAMVFVLSSQTNAKTTIKLLEVITSPERSIILRQLLNQFEATHNDVRVEVTSVPWGEALEQVILMADGGNAPDVIEMPDRWLALFAGGGLLLNLEEKLEKWPHYKTLEQKTMELARHVDGTYTIPYGLYLRAMFYNKKLLKKAGIEKPPHTMDEFMAALKAVTQKTGKYGYCFRGGLGGLNAWFMMAAAMNGTKIFFTKSGRSKINDEGSVKGLQFMIDIYQKGYAPKESIDWGFDDVVSNFYSGNCAFLDQDPDALSLIEPHMDKDDFAITAMPVGPLGKSFPTIGFAGWSIFRTSKIPKQSWELISFLSSPEKNLRWVEKIGIIQIHKNVNKDDYLKDERFSGWYQELNDEAYQPMVMPTYLEQFGNFADSIALYSSREALLGQRTAQEIADLWAEILTAEYARWQAVNKSGKLHSGQ